MKQFASTDILQLNRRDFLKVVGGLGISAATMTLLDACGVKPAAPIPENAPLETTTIRLPLGPAICVAPMYIAEDLLGQEGFTTVEYVEVEDTGGKYIASGDADIGMDFAAPVAIRIERGEPITILSGVHVGCFILFSTNQLNSIKDLRGKTIPVSSLGGVGTQYLFLASMMAWVGLDPNKDINWIVEPVADQKQLMIDGKVDALLAFPPGVQELRAKKIGNVALNSMMDDPWSQYFCCMLLANKGFAQNNPVATKRAMRAILKSADICALQPERAAKFMVEKGFTKNYDYALQAMKDIPYNKWREYDPADTLLFYSLRLRDVGMIKSSPEEIIAKGTDWSFLNELKREWKG
jgi:NitT/TauT family transport system substrate-binding protein